MSVFEDEYALIRALRAREDEAFVELLDRLQPRLMKTASSYVRDPRVAEEVVQSTWMAVLNGIDRFERRSSLSTWIHSILINHARTAGRREQRYEPLPDSESAAPRAKGPDRQLLDRELRAVYQRALAGLPKRQREVVELRDVHGLSSEEVCIRVGLSEANQRVLLHRARSRVRAELVRYLEG